MNEQQQPEKSDSEPSHQKPNWREVVSSVLAAGFGVQSKENRERDFQHGKPVVFIAAGIIFTVLFIATIFGVVSVVLKSAT